MAHCICPHWLGYLLLLNPFRKWAEDPNRLLGPFIQEGMTVLEPGCGMGYFTLPLARMVGKHGRVVALEIQPRMLSVVERRARRSGLLDRLELRQIKPNNLGVNDLSNKVDFVAAIHMVHEVHDQHAFFADIWQVLKPGGKIFIVEPKGHVSHDDFERTVTTANKIGFVREPLSSRIGGCSALFVKSGL
jgi:ubiquinone/menaquinone biosynthesis C-methylase UbiE